MRYVRREREMVEMVQWSGSNWHEVLAFAGKDQVFTRGADLWLRVPLEDWGIDSIPVEPGEVIVRFVDEAKASITMSLEEFTETYEPVEETAAA